MKKSYSEKFRIEIAGMYINGKSADEIHAKTGVAKSTVYKWVDEYKKEFTNKSELNLRDYHDLKVKCERLEEIIEILKTTPCTPSAPLRERYKAIEEMKSNHSESLLCDALNVSKGSYYNHIFRNKNDTNMFVQREAELKPVIEEIFFENNNLFGPNKIQAILKDRGYNVSYRVVSRIMHENNLFAVRTSSKKLYEMSLERKTNILAQQFQVNAPDEVWVSDVTYFKIQKKTYYICAIIDLYARKVISYNVSDRNTTKLTMKTFDKAFLLRCPSPEKLLFHSDNGANYTSRAIMTHIKELGVKQSFSRPGIPYDNSVMESFFKTLKAEELYIGRYKSEKDLKEGIANYIDFYNNKRPHSVIRYSTPQKYEDRFYNKNKKRPEEHTSSLSEK